MFFGMTAQRGLLRKNSTVLRKIEWNELRCAECLDSKYNGSVGCYCQQQHHMGQMRKRLEEGERFRGRTEDGQREERRPSTHLSQVSWGSRPQGKLIRKLAKYVQVLKIGLAGGPGSPEPVLLPDLWKKWVRAYRPLQITYSGHTQKIINLLAFYSFTHSIRQPSFPLTPVLLVWDTHFCSTIEEKTS